jgi:hypothetical protein
VLPVPVAAASPLEAVPLGPVADPEVVAVQAASQLAAAAVVEEAVDAAAEEVAVVEGEAVEEAVVELALMHHSYSQEGRRNLVLLLVGRVARDGSEAHGVFGSRDEENCSDNYFISSAGEEKR